MLKIDKFILLSLKIDYRKFISHFILYISCTFAKVLQNKSNVYDFDNEVPVMYTCMSLF